VIEFPGSARMSALRVALTVPIIAAIHLTTLSVPVPPDGTYGVSRFLAAGGSRVVVDLVLLSLFGALFVVPLNSFVQHNAPERSRARTLALNNLMNALFMLIAAVVGAVLLTLAELTIGELFLVMALMNVAVSLFIFQQVPLFAARFLVWLLGHTLYRIRHEHLELHPFHRLHLFDERRTAIGIDDLSQSGPDRDALNIFKQFRRGLTS